jgi:hypothetical protein
VVGVFVTLLATGIFTHASHSGGTATPAPTPKPVADAALHAQIQRIVSRQLGKFTDNRQLRLVSLRLLRVRSLEALTDSVGVARYRSVYLEFRLNDNPLGPTWRLRTAKADIFDVLKALYSSGLPVYDTLLIGMYPLKRANQTKDTQAVVAYETHDDANRIPWKQWGRENEGTVWNDLSYKSVDPRFA